MTQSKALLNQAREVGASSFSLFKQSDKRSKLITAVDFVMQVQPCWLFYGLYTAARCAHLSYQYAKSPKEKEYLIWQNAQVYASTKVLGLVFSQIALTALGLTTPLSVALIFAWGAVLFSLSMYAKYRSNQPIDFITPMSPSLS